MERVGNKGSDGEPVRGPADALFFVFYLAWHDTKASNVIAGDFGGSHACVARAVLVKRKFEWT